MIRDRFIIRFLRLACILSAGAALSSCRANNAHQQKVCVPATSSTSSRPGSIEPVATRRATLHFALLGIISSSLLTEKPPAFGFPNKISNQYDDRPKRRGSKPVDLGVMKRTTADGYDEYAGFKTC